MSEQTPRQAPTGIKVTAWMWILSGLLLGLSPVLGALFSSVLGELPADASLPPQMAEMAASAGHFGALDVVQLALAGVALWAGIALLRLKAWARTAIEMLTWLSLAGIVGFGVLFLDMWHSMAGVMAQQAGIPVDQNMLQSVGMATAVILTIAFAVPLALMIRYLRGAEARAATAGDSGKK